MMIALAAMQGMGKPGINIWSTTQGCPADDSLPASPVTPRAASAATSTSRPPASAGSTTCSPSRQGATRITHDSTGPGHLPPAHPRGSAARAHRVAGQGFLRLLHREPVAEVRVPGAGYAVIQHVLALWRLVLRHHDRRPTATSRPTAIRKLSSSVNQSIWMEGETKFADIILPACTNFERWDIGEWASCSGYIPDATSRPTTG